eukprot:TRINITY_DN710_c0_g1_i4.p1 TRINITY_DN710_c0_g1~~TRINITY_DN710_c0_g1_i4.p1  ORF type:complete len:490 (-),score=93.97 TRINITY_DN710_c0_g1_i4:440-1909(-)
MSAALKNIYAATPRTVRGSPVQLSGDPKGENFLYCSGQSVFIRNLANPLIVDVYSEHPCATTVARYAPSRFYIASADEQGNVRIWDTTQKEHILKFETKPFAGSISDLSWSPDSQRIVAVGEGREKFGHVFSWDAGNSVGEITGHTKAATSCDMKPTRPFRIISGGIDQTSVQYDGPPFKYRLAHTDHSKFVNCVRYAPDGERYLTVGSDGKGFFYEAKDGAKVGELGAEGAHTGGIMSCSWSPDSKQVLTVSVDKTAKIWDVATSSVVQTFAVSDAPTTDDQLLGCLWQGTYLLAVALDGTIYYLDKATGKPSRALKGHNKFVKALGYNKADGSIYSAAYDGQLVRWTEGSGNPEAIRGAGHTNEVSAIAVESGAGRVITAAMDDTYRIVDHAAKAQTGTVVKLDGPLCDLDIPTDQSNGVGITATHQSVVLIRGDKAVFTQKVQWKPLSVAISPDAVEAAVGGDVIEFCVSVSDFGFPGQPRSHFFD